MNISISSLAWEKSLEKKVLDILSQNDIRFIDIVPNKYLKSCLEFDKNEVIDLRNYFNKKNLSIYGMQSLLYEIKQFNLFKSYEDRKIILSYLENIFRIAELLNVKKLVFGSPGSRYKLNDNDNENKIAFDFFSEIGKKAKKYNVYICIEPAPKIYKCNFLNNTEETAIFVKKINHSNIKLQIDSGSIRINRENILEILQKYNDIIGHAHISNPFLKPIIDDIEYIRNFCKLSYLIKDLKIITIEMLYSSKESCIKEVETSVKLIKRIYKDI